MRRIWRRIFSLKVWLIGLTTLFLGFLLLDVLAPLPQEKSYSKVILANDGSLLSAFLSPDDKWRMKAELDEINSDLQHAIVSKEDRWFWYHPGVNPVAILRAAWYNLRSGKRSSGASTITMQLARMMEPKARTLGNKLFEVFRALQLEWHYSKSDILARYLSYLPYGGNIEGVKAASYIYFDRPPSALSLAQATLLTVIPNRPNSLRIDQRKDLARAARDKWLRRFAKEKAFPSTQVQAALDEPITAYRRQLKLKAPHLSRRLARLHRNSEIHSTIVPEIQATAEQLLANYVRRVRSKGISNGAVLVLDNRNSAVVAYCGSADYADVTASGQVDGIQAIRSPGSTLKPVAYAMGFDKGIYTPDTRMLDVPSTWSGYSPRNYDEKFRGPVSLAYALRHSLNITAVQAVVDVGFENFANLLEAAGMATIRKQREDLGLSTVLGGCGVTLEELTGLFSAFAREGRRHPLAYTQAQVAAKLPGSRLFSPAAAWMIGDILSGVERPDLPVSAISASTRGRIAWKTGTSYGRRDAWSIGFTPHFTIGVWIGNFDGRGVADLSGAKLAGPLLFDLFGGLQKGLPKLEFEPPLEIIVRDICAETGDLPSAHCRRIREGYAIRDGSHRNVCSQPQLLYISSDSAVQYCTGCLPQSGYLKSSFAVYPPALTLWYENNDIPYRKPPPHNPACTATFDGNGPNIISPSPDYEYLIETGSGQEILLQAASDSRVNRHYWYVNDKFLQSCAPGEKVFFAPNGKNVRISCMDDKGRRAEIKVQIGEY
ncbi:MAG TPA: penicillin-binding protein 1C [Bacteroidetes bacterium]|nr:penicillin-binding protein 1C [Bacteroidota bacterium]